MSEKPGPVGRRILPLVTDRADLPWIKPMKPVVGLPDDGSEWTAELKWDGVRTGLATDGQRTVLHSSRGRDVSPQYPELADFGRKLGTSAHLDGEIVVFDGDRPSFRRVLHRINIDRPNQRTMAENPIVYVVFDLLTLDGNSLLELPYQARREVLTDLVSDGPSWRIPPSVPGGSSQLLTLAKQRDLEGIMVKRLDSAYRPGSRSADWRKVKIRLRQEFVVGGWLAGRGSLEQEIGSLVLGVWDGDDFVVAGLAGSGLTDEIRRDLHRRFTTRDTSPFVAVPPLDRRPTWVEPDTVIEAEFGDWPAEGMLRFPVFAGLRHDKDPNEVVREIPPPGGS